MVSPRLCAALLIPLAAAAPGRGADRAPVAPATRPAAAPTTRRARAGLDVEGPAMRFHALFPKLTDLADPDQRAAKGPQAIGILKKIVAALDGQSPSMRAMNARTRDSFATVLIALGDGETRAATERQAAGTGPDADRAKRMLLTSKWVLAARDPAQQAAMADGVTEMVKADPTNPDLTLTVLTLSRYAASPEMKRRLEDLALNHMQNRTVTAYKAELAKQEKVKVVEGKPMVLSGTTPDGKPFTTADWKGKVILVDFWAVWCGPCKAELPRVKQVYADYHDKGLEVLGVDNDETAHAVTMFTAKDGLPWPELYDAQAAAQHKMNSITTGFGINGIPVMFLIDKKGVCRSVEAREDFEKLIPQMLAE